MTTIDATGPKVLKLALNRAIRYSKVYAYGYYQALSNRLVKGGFGVSGNHMLAPERP